MGASSRKPAGRIALATLGVLCSAPFGVSAQIAASPELTGTAFVGDALMSDGTVVLHHLTEGTQGELDSLSLDSAGKFTFSLPNVPDPARGDVFFASIRHDGVLYFGPAITTAVQLDSVYEIHTYDTLSAPMEGYALALQSRSVFLEPDSTDWRVTDLFQLRNDADRTIVARPGGRVWGHALPEGAREVTTGEGELSVAAATIEDGGLVVRAALPPGERLFVVRYRVDSPLLAIPNQTVAEAFDVLVREPAPPLEVEGLDLLDRVELEAGSTYLRFTGNEVSTPLVRIVEAETEGRLRVQWAAVILALVLAVSGVTLIRPTRLARVGDGAPNAAPSRRALMIEVARLDEEFSGSTDQAAGRKSYERRRAELIRQIQRVE